MPHFRFRYVDSDGVTHAEEAEAEDRDSLTRELQSKRSTILEISEIALPTGAESKNDSSARPLKLWRRKLSSEDLAVYTRQIATMLAAGLPLMKILGIMRKRCPNQTLADVLDDVSRRVQNGARFSDSLANHPMFSELYINMLRVGEASGKMEHLTERLATLLEKDCALEGRVKSATAYPAFILLFTIALSWGIVAFLMPLFIPVFTSSGLDIQGDYPLTYWLIVLSRMLNDPITIVIVVALGAAAFFGFGKFKKTPQGARLLGRLAFSLPLFGNLVRIAAAARFARTLSTLMHSGMPLLQSLNLVGAMTGNAVTSDAVAHVANQITKGKRISDAIESESKVFPDMLIQLAQVGEESGQLPTMLEKAGDYYDSQLDSAIQRLVAFLEPAMMMVVGVIVCGFVMAVLLPILGLAQAK